MAESDWSPYDVQFTTGKRAIVQALSYVLVTSTRKFFALYESNGLHALMDGHKPRLRALRRLRARAASTTARSPSCCAGRAISPSTIRASSRSRVTTSFARSPSDADTPTTSRAPSDASGRSSARSSTAASSATSTTCARQLAHWLDNIVDHRRRHKSTALERFAEERSTSCPCRGIRYDTARVDLPRLRHRRLRRLGGKPLRRSLRPRNRPPARARHAARALRLRRRPRCVARHELAPRGAGLELDPRRPPPAARSARARIDLDQVARRLRATWASAPPLLPADEPRRAARLGRPGAADPAAARALSHRRYRPRARSRRRRSAPSTFPPSSASSPRTPTPRTLDEYVAEDTAQRIEQTLGQAAPSRATSPSTTACRLVRRFAPRTPHQETSHAQARQQAAARRQTRPHR